MFTFVVHIYFYNHSSILFPNGSLVLAYLRCEILYDTSFYQVMAFSLIK